MKIKRLEMRGFKSFVDPTVIQFDTSIVGIVGPNGVGKSNIVDAIRWVMGEMSAKSLRGHAMEDVIFNGSEARPPLGGAEVSLTFSTEDGIVPMEYAGPPGSGFPEITITRRLYRSGESEYQINKTTSRLRDIIELFLGTGVGHKAYSVIEQGKIDFAINAKPEDRRLLIEEAAGVSKFKARKEAALRRMEGTKNNLARLKDIVAEVTRQCHSLDRQVRKAERYRTLKNELREKEVRLHSHRSLEKTRETGELKGLLEDWLKRDNDAMAKVGIAETEMEEKRLLLVEKEQELNALQERFYELSSRQKLLEAKEEYQKKEIQSLLTQQERSVQTVEQLKEEFTTFKNELEDLLRSHEESGDTGRLADTLKEIEERWKEADSRRSEISQLLQETRLTIHRLESEGGRLDSERRLFEEQQVSLHGRMARVATESSEGERLAEELRTRLAHYQRNRDHLIQSLNLLQQEKEELREEITKLKEHKELMEEEFSIRQEEVVQKRSRLKSLLDLERNFEGYEEGVRSILKAKKEGIRSEGIFGVVADFVDAPPQFETAVSAALGEKLQHVIVKSHEEGVEAISYLKTQSSGRSTFIPLAPREIAEEEPFPHQGTGIIGPLVNLISIRPEFKQIGQYLFGDIVLVESLSKALSLWKSNGHTKTLVTLDGEVVDPFGVVTGGTDAIRGKILLEKKREIRELRTLLAELEEALSLKEDAISQAEGTLSEISSNWEGVGQKEHEREVKLASLSKEVSLMEEEARHDLQEKERLAAELFQLKEEEEKIKALLRAGEKRRQELEGTRKESETILREREEAARKIEAETRLLSEELTKTKVSAAAILERQRIFEQEEGRLQKGSRDLEQKIEEEIANLSSLQERRDDLEKGQKESHEENQTLKGEVEKLSAAQEEVRKGYEELSGTVRGLEETLRQARKEMELARSHTTDLRVTLTQLEADLQHSESQMMERYSFSLREGASAYQGIEINEETEEGEVTQLKEKLEKLGDVNLGAIPEYEELKNRQTFLETQIGDLENSLDSLQRAIQKINQTTRKRFEETFALVSERFEKLLPRLFRGGRAELRLVEEEGGPQGVDLLVQPPGKKLSHISLLSGGEKALAAVGFIFSIFLVKPSPFCILDEVDAPLDDANVDRFLQLLSDTVDRTQFILITHSRRTMEKCDLLYGVTMEEAGVSKTVSVRFNNQPETALAS